MNWLIRWLKRKYKLYDYNELTVGGHCGCCGKWVDKAIVEKGWEWTLCESDCCKENERRSIKLGTEALKREQAAAQEVKSLMEV